MDKRGYTVRKPETSVNGSAYSASRAQKFAETLSSMCGMGLLTPLERRLAAAGGYQLLVGASSTVIQFTFTVGRCHPTRHV